MGDGRTYDHVCALRAVTSTDGMTADIYPFDANFLSRCATRIIHEVQGINRVVYEYNSKPPGTLAWQCAMTIAYTPIGTTDTASSPPYSHSLVPHPRGPH